MGPMARHVYLTGYDVIAETTAAIPNKFFLNDEGQALIVGYAPEAKSAIYNFLVCLHMN